MSQSLSIPASVIKAYRQLQNTVRVEKLGNGLINTTWKIQCGEEAYILQKINHHVFRDPYIIENNLKQIAAFIHSHDADYQLPLPLKTLCGEELVFDTAHGYFRLFPFWEGSVTHTVLKTVQQAFEAARLFGKFAKKLNGLDPKLLGASIPDFHNLSLRYHQFMNAVDQADRNRKERASLLIHFLQEHACIVEAYESYVHAGTMQLRVMHHDTKISNVLFDDEDHGLAVIDLDTVMPGYFISDLGDMIRTYTCAVNEEEAALDKITIRKDFFEAIIKGYLSEMKDVLSDAEKKLLVFAGEFMIYMQCLRFATDYLENDRYYGSSYSGHNLNRALNQMKLLQELIQQKPAFENSISLVLDNIRA